MTLAFNQLFDFNAPVFRNISGKPDHFDEFDDLSTDPEARACAHRFVEATEIHALGRDDYNQVINSIFAKRYWRVSRFSNGSYPVWYGAGDLETSFYETLHHWQKTFLDAPKGFNTAKNQTVSTVRAVYQVHCRAALLDFRNKIQPDQELEVGQRIHQEGFPGLIADSAQHAGGECVAVFKKEVLSNPVFCERYQYEWVEGEIKIAKVP